MTSAPSTPPSEVERQAFRRLPKFLRLALSGSKEYQELNEDGDKAPEQPDSDNAS